MLRRIGASPLPVSARTFSSSATRSGQHPFGLAEGLPARRQRRAGDGQPAQRADVTRERHAVGAQAILDLGDTLRRDAEQQEVLASGDAQLRHRAVGRQLAQRRAQPHPVAVGDLARWHRQADDAVTRAVVLLGHPRREVRRRVEREPDPPPDLGADPLDATRLDEVLQPGAVAVLAVAVVALRRDDRLDDVDDPVGRHPPQWLGEQRVGVVLAGVAHAQAAADVDVVAGDVTDGPAAQCRHDPDVVGVDVDAVVARPGDGDLELARQVDVAVDRLDRALAALRPAVRQRRRLGGDGLLAVDPQLPVRRRLRAEPGDQRGDERFDDVLALVGPRRAHDVAHDVAARGDRRQQRQVDAAHQVLAGRPCGRRGTARPGGSSGASCRRPGRRPGRAPATARR